MTQDPDGLRDRDLARMALRASALQATWNYERQQGLGWAWALQPALERLYPDPEQRRERLAEHTAYFNTQPTLASLALGAVAALEQRRAAGTGPGAEGVRRVKSVLGSSLAALGDRLFWATLRPFAACLGVLWAVHASWLGALVLWLSYNVVHQPIRWLGVGWGYRGGAVGVGERLRRRLERAAYALGVAGSALVGLLVAVLMVPRGTPQTLMFQVLLAAGLGFGLLTAQRPRPSPTTWGMAVGLVAVASAWLT